MERVGWIRHREEKREAISIRGSRIASCFKDVQGGDGGGSARGNRRPAAAASRDGAAGSCARPRPTVPRRRAAPAALPAAMASAASSAARSSAVTSRREVEAAGAHARRRRRRDRRAERRRPAGFGPRRLSSRRRSASSSRRRALAGPAPGRSRCAARGCCPATVGEERRQRPRRRGDARAASGVARRSGAMKWRRARDVLAALAQRRQLDGDDGQPLVEVLGRSGRGRSASSRSRLVAATMPEVDRGGACSPSRVTWPSSSTRSSFTCVASGVSSISSRKTVPPRAAISLPSTPAPRPRRRPWRGRRAPTPSARWGWRRS